MIQGAGLGSYYQRRVLDPHLPAPKPEDDVSVDPTPFIRDNDDGTHTLHLMVEGLQCAACVWLIETVLGRMAGVVRARLNMTTRRLEVVWRAAETNADDIIATVQKLGYGVMPYDPALIELAARKGQRALLRAMAVAGFAAANVMLLSVAVWSGAGEGAGGGAGPATRQLFHWLSALIALPALLYAGRPFYRSAARALIHGRTNMDVPITLALFLTAGMSLFETMRAGPHVYFESTVMLLFFLLVGRFLDRRARARAQAQAERLTQLVASSVTVIDDAGVRQVVAIGRVRAGMTVLVAPGERVPVDGTVETGTSELDCSLITGESVPVAVCPGGTVHAGTLNISAALRIHVQAAGEDTVLAGITRLMDAAAQARGRHVALADRLARLYAPVVHVLALLSFLGWVFVGGMAWQEALLIATAVLIITCPCALALAVPVVQVVAVSRLMRRGVLVKTPTALERLAAVDTVVFDKTGTLTRAALVLTGGNFNDDDLAFAARLAATSTHPLARALVLAHEKRAGAVRPADDVREVPGSGIMDGQGMVRLGRRDWVMDDGASDDGDGPALWLARPPRAAVVFRFDDPPRDDATATVAALGARGLGVSLLSGDGARAVSRAARETGIDAFQANLRPEDKCAELARLSDQGARTLMVGDGLNDAPALAAAFVSASPAAAADITQTAADVVFQGARLGGLVELLDVAGRALALVKQNLGFALLYNAVTIPLAVAGLVTPLVAAVSMSASSIVVIVNALRLNR